MPGERPLHEGVMLRRWHMLRQLQLRTREPVLSNDLQTRADGQPVLLGRRLLSRLSVQGRLLHQPVFRTGLPPEPNVQVRRSVR